LLFETLKGKLGGNDVNPIQSRTAKCNKGRFWWSYKEKTLRKRNRIDLIEKYSERNLTFPANRLPAISAIAELFSHGRKDAYVAGFWRRQLESQLLWKSNGYEEVRPGSKKLNQGPSWSWASSQYSVHFSRLAELNIVNKLEILDISVEYEDDKVRFGACVSGSIRMLRLASNDHESRDTKSVYLEVAEARLTLAEIERLSA
jgi:hypothetical protein